MRKKEKRGEKQSKKDWKDPILLNKWR